MRDRAIDGKFVKGHKNYKKAKLKIKCICKWCKKEFERYPSTKGDFCSKLHYWLDKKDKTQPQLLKNRKPPWNKGKKILQMRGENHPNYKNGSWINHNGYRVIQSADKTSGEKILEHRVIMEKHTERKLRKEEHIHHLNGDKLDNRLENLIIVSPSEHQLIHAKIRTQCSKKIECVCAYCGKKEMEFPSQAYKFCTRECFMRSNENKLEYFKMNLIQEKAFLTREEKKRANSR